MGKKYIFEVEDETQLIVEIGVNSTGAAVITTKHPKYLTPYEEPDLDAIRNEAYEKGVQDTKQHWVDDPRTCAYRLGYENGLNDAWDAARKIYLNVNEGGLSANALTIIFGNKSMIQIFKEFSASEATEKIRQYEESKEKHTWICSEVNEPSVDTTLICSECGYAIKIKPHETPGLNFCPKCGDCKKPKEEEE